MWPRQCPCLVDGARYWPGQRVEADCQLCICRDGRPQGCRPSPDCAGASHRHPARGSSRSPPRPPSRVPAFLRALTLYPFSVNCGWSSWSPWAECLGPCGSRGIQWSFRSPNNPRLSGQGRQCRGIYRKARRYLMPPAARPARTRRALAPPLALPARKLPVGSFSLRVPPHVPQAPKETPLLCTPSV